jgi:pimeloyl-ACP methyl ester carboxylesterase
VDAFAMAGMACTDFRGATIIPDVGHWVQQEAPDATNAALDAFLKLLK